MAQVVNPFRDQHAEVDVDILMEDFSRQMVGTNGSMNANDMILWGVIAGILVLILIALAIVYGRLNRQKNHYEDDSDFFDNRFEATNSGYGADDMASIRITREDDERDPGPLTSHAAEEPFEEPFEEPVQFEDEAPQNVVPLRVPEQDTQPMVRAEEPRREPLQMAASEGGSDYEYRKSAQPQDQSSHRGNWQQPTYDERMSSRYDDEDQPFVAPFIREYIEESERRQFGRLDDLRDDMRRQLSGIREEQSSRLDLFLNSIERKLGKGVVNVDQEDGAATRRRMDGMNSTIERMNQSMERQSERLTELSRSMEQRMTEFAPLRGDLRSVHDDLLSFRRDVEANTLAIGQLREHFDRLKEDFGRMERSFLERAKSDQAVTMRLADVVRGTLDDDEYELNSRLSNGHTADCVIFLNGGRNRVAIDSRFPIESFNRLPSRDAVRRNLPQAKAGEDEFRRTVLRSIFACADRCIINGETTDSAILFLPSEAAYTILHDRFPDLVRDSHRARVWLTSPSTLMGTLNLLHNVLAPDPRQEPEPIHEDDFSDDVEGPFYAGPETNERRDRASDLEERLRALREEEEALAEELLRARETGGRRRYESDVSGQRRTQSDDDFETRLERFSFDIEGEKGGYDYDDDPSRRRFRSADRDDDLR